MTEIVLNVFDLLLTLLILWSTYEAFKISKPLALGVFLLWFAFFPYFAFKYREQAKGPVKLFLVVLIYFLLIVVLDTFDVFL